MNKKNTYSLLFLPDYLAKSFKSLDIKPIDILDAVKEINVKYSLENYGEHKEARINIILEKLYKYVGKGDLKDLYKFNEVLLGYLHLINYENNFHTLFDVLSSGEYSNEENIVCLEIFKKQNMDNVSFKDTYEISYEDGITVIILKEGFGNYVAGGDNKTTKLCLLKDIIENNNNDDIIKTSIGVSYLKITNL